MTKESRKTIEEVMRKTMNMSDEKKKIVLWVGTGIDLANDSREPVPEQKTA